MDGTKRVDGVDGVDGPADVKGGCGGEEWSAEKRACKACAAKAMGNRIPIGKLPPLPREGVGGIPLSAIKQCFPPPSAARELTLADAEQQAFQSGRWMVAVFWVEKGRVNGFARQSYFPMDDYPNAVDQFCAKLIPGLIGNAGRTTTGVAGQSPEAAPDPHGPAIQVMEEETYDDDDRNADGNASLGTDPDVMAG